MSTDCQVVSEEFVSEKNSSNDSSLNTTISSSQQNVTSPCAVCSKVTSKRDRVFECTKCKKLTHFGCTRLPGYAVFSIKSSKRQYICEICAAPPEEFLKLYDAKQENQEDKDTFNDIFGEIKRAADAVTKMDVETMWERLCERIKRLTN